MTGRSRGFGFVTFQNSSDAQKVTQQNNLEIEGRQVLILYLYSTLILRSLPILLLREMLASLVTGCLVSITLKEALAQASDPQLIASKVAAMLASLDAFAEMRRTIK